MRNSKKQITVNTTAPTCPETVQELIDFLAQCPPDSELSFHPLTLYRLKDRSGVIQFEFNEIEGRDYIISDRDNSQQANHFEHTSKNTNPLVCHGCQGCQGLACGPASAENLDMLTRNLDEVQFAEPDDDGFAFVFRASNPELMRSSRDATEQPSLQVRRFRRL